MRPELQVKQFVATVQGRFSRFRVFETGDPKVYLFSQIDPKGCDTGLQVPVRKGRSPAGRPGGTAAWLGSRRETLT